MLVDVLSGAAALVGVGEAHLIGVVVALDDIVTGGGGGEGKHPVLIGQRRHGQGGLGGDGTHQQLQALVHQLVVGVDRGLGVVDVVSGDELKLDVSTQGVDLIHGNLSGVDHVGAVNSGVTGEGAHHTHSECSGIAAACIVLVAASGQHTHTHGARHEHRCNLLLFHYNNLPFYRFNTLQENR